MMKKTLSLSDLGVAFPGGMPSEELLHTVKRAEQDGFSACWISEDYYYGGAMATAGAIAAVTEWIGIGVGVVNPFTRSPEVIAMEAAVVDAVSKGRFQLAVGASNRRWIEEQMCIPFQKPRTRMAEAVRIISGLLRGETVNLDGETISAHQVRLDFQTYRKDMPVCMGVSGEKSLRQAGAVADGVLLSSMIAVPYAAWARRVVDEGARAAGRETHIPISVYVPLFLGDPEEGRKAFAPTIAHYTGVAAKRAFIRESGASEEEIRPLAERFAAGRSGEDLVTQALADRFAVCGDARRCRERLEAYLDAGVDQLILCACGDVSALQMMEFAKEILK